MSDTEKRARQWAKRHLDFRYLVDSDLVGWLWPWEYQKLVERMKAHNPVRYEALKGAILPVEATRQYEKLHPDYVAAKAGGLLV